MRAFPAVVNSVNPYLDDKGRQTAAIQCEVSLIAAPRADQANADFDAMSPEDRRRAFLPVGVDVGTQVLVIQSGDTAAIMGALMCAIRRTDGRQVLYALMDDERYVCAVEPSGHTVVCDKRAFMSRHRTAKLPESVAPKREVCVRVTGSDGAEAEISVSDSDHPALVSFVRNCIDNEAAPIDVVHPSEEVDVAIAKRVPSATPWVIHLRLPQYRPGDSLYLPDDGLGRLLLAPPSAEFATKVIVTGPAGPGR